MEADNSAQWVWVDGGGRGIAPPVGREEIKIDWVAKNDFWEIRGREQVLFD